MPKTLAEVREELVALGTVTEDQYEASLAAALVDFDAAVAALPATPVAPTVASITFTDGTTQVVPPSQTGTATGAASQTA